MANRMQPSPARVMAQAIKAGEIVAAAIREMDQVRAELDDEILTRHLMCEACTTPMAPDGDDKRPAWECPKCSRVVPRFLHSKCGEYASILIDMDIGFDAIGAEYTPHLFCAVCLEEFTDQEKDQVLRIDIVEDEDGAWQNVHLDNHH